MPKLMFVVTEDWYFVSHRLSLAEQAISQGFEVILVTNASNLRAKIEKAGISVVELKSTRRGLNPLTLAKEVFNIALIIRRLKPDLVHLISLRPVIAGGFASLFFTKTKFIFAVTGMGYLFTAQGRQPVARRLIEAALPVLVSGGYVIVQNRDDAQQLTDMGIATDNLRLIPGVGVNTDEFSPIGRHLDERPIVMFAARLLRDKGVIEFVEAARLLGNGTARFVIVGRLDQENPTSITADELDSWIDAKAIEWWGHSDNMSETLAKADVFCLPSYREGLPKVLLEAMACGLACVSTDVPGCRDVVVHGKTGLLVPSRDGQALAIAISQLISNDEQRKNMGEAGRLHVQSHFDQHRICQETIAIYHEAMHST